MTRSRDDASALLKERAKRRFAVATKLEKEYLRSLQQLTSKVDEIVRKMAARKKDDDLTKNVELQQALRRYAERVRPWARKVAAKMVARIARTDEASWAQMGREMGRGLRKELQDAPTGDMLRAFMDEQVHLITSLPMDAAERVHKITQEALITGRRADSIAKEIMETGRVTKSRAKLIARTEVARTAAGLTQARAQHIGVTHYVWRTSGDADVRKSHAEMNGKIIAFDTPPEVEPGKFYHAGMFPNCRCHAEPIIED